MSSLSIIKGFSSYRILFFTLMWCCLCTLFTGCENRRTIVNSLDEKEANEIVVYLSGKGIEATKVKKDSGGGGGQKAAEFDITVPESIATDAMSLLNQAGLPRRRSQNLLGIFSQSSLVPSEMQEKIRYQAGIAEQIAGTIRKIDGILDADVQISFPQEDPLNPGQTKGKITASVYVKHSGVLDDPNSHLLTKIKRLVAASVTGLNYDDVTVIPERSRYFDYQQSSMGGNPEEKEYVSIWTLILAKDSVSRFRTIFFSFTFLILLLVLSMLWLGWKLYPLLEKAGGIKELLTLHQLSIKTDEKTGAKSAVAKDEKKEKAPAQEQVDKDIDET